jgi:hypothetical protein
MYAQDVKSTTEIKADNGKSVVYTGCLVTAVETMTFVLDHAVPVKETETQTVVGASGLPETTTKTTLKYALVPGEKVDLQKSIGHTVQVTAVLIPAGDDQTKIESTTKTKVEGQPTEKSETKEKVGQGDMPRLRIMSVKNLSDTCQS